MFSRFLHIIRLIRRSILFVFQKNGRTSIVVYYGIGMLRTRVTENKMSFYIVPVQYNILAIGSSPKSQNVLRMFTLATRGYNNTCIMFCACYLIKQNKYYNIFSIRENTIFFCLSKIIFLDFDCNHHVRA